MAEFKVYPIYFDKYLCDMPDLTQEQFRNRYFGRSLIRGCLQFNDFILADDPWDYNIPKNR